MSHILEHDYIGLSDVSSMESSEKTSSTTTEGGEPLNLKETELRLGLPGSMSPERRVGGAAAAAAAAAAAGVGVGLSLQIKGGGVELGVLKTFSSGAKRGFSDAIDGSGKWGFPGNGGGSEVDLGKGGGVMFSPRGGNGGKPLGGLLDNGAQHPASAMKDVVPPSPNAVKEKKPQIDHSPPAKAQVVGWPPIRSYRKNTMAANPSKNTDDAEGKSGSGCLYVKVSMDGAPYLRKVDLRTYSNYMELSSALEKMFSCFTIGHCSSDGEGLSESRLKDLHVSEYVLTYEDKDSDWMLVGDVPWDMFIDSCRRLRIMKGSEAIGLALCKNRNQQHH